MQELIKRRDELFKRHGEDDAEEQELLRLLSEDILGFGQAMRLKRAAVAAREKGQRV